MTIINMAYSEERKEKIFTKIITRISDEGHSIRSILREKGMPSSSTFFKWLEDDEKFSKRYARACEIRAEVLLEEMIDIADNVVDDFVDIKDFTNEGSEITVGKKVNYENIQRSKLRVDTRKWIISKLNPKKYGDKLDLTSDGEKLNSSIPLVLEDGRTYEDLKNELKLEEEE